MDIAEQLDNLAGTNHLVLVEFYADWSPHYEWLEPVVKTYEKQVSDVIKVNIVEDKAVADSFNIETAPAFILLHRGHELWRQVGELTMGELKDVLDEFR
ncbi:thioredoxin family protein [Bacteroides sp.]